MAKYFIKYHTGAGDEWIEGTLQEAMKTADELAAYTQQSISIEDEAGNEVARRPWWGVKYDPDVDEAAEDEVIQFGDYGYYGAWQLR